MDETTFTILMTNDLVEQVNIYRLPDQSIQEVMIQALNIYLTLAENQQNRPESAAYFDQIGVLKPRLTLLTRSLRKSLVFYCQLGFQIHFQHPNFPWVSLSSRGLVINLMGSSQAFKAEDTNIDINFTTNTNLEFLAEQLKTMGIEVNEANILNNIDSPEIIVTDPDGREISIWSDRTTENDAWL